MGTLCCNPSNSLEVGNTGREGSWYMPEAPPRSPQLEDDERECYTDDQRDNREAAPYGARYDHSRTHCSYENE